MEKVTEATLHLEKVTEATLQFRIPKSNLSLNYSQKFFWSDWTTIVGLWTQEVAFFSGIVSTRYVLGLSNEKRQNEINDPKIRLPNGE